MSTEDSQETEYSDTETLAGLLLVGGIAVAVLAHLYMSGMSDADLAVSAAARGRYNTAETFRGLGMLSAIIGFLIAISTGDE